MRKRTKRSERYERRVVLTLQLYAYDLRELYAALVWIQRDRHYDRRWVAHCFKDLLGGWPRPSGKVEPEPPPPELVEWIALRPKPKKKKR
jgi:hypothetical protein